MLPDSYFTLAGSTNSETKVQRSRFIAVAAPAADETAARQHIAEVRRHYHDSRHVCHAWRLGLGTEMVENRNDDGEPSGTGGEPILAAIRRGELTQVVVAVVRYFGGIKLGTGGLARAYGGAADQVLATAPRREVLLGREFSLTLPYADRKTVQYLLDKHRGKVLEETYTAEIIWRLWLPHSTWEAFLSTLIEVSAGKLCPEPCPEKGA